MDKSEILKECYSFILSLHNANMTHINIILSIALIFIGLVVSIAIWLNIKGIKSLIIKEITPIKEELKNEIDFLSKREYLSHAYTIELISKNFYETGKYSLAMQVAVSPLLIYHKFGENKNLIRLLEIMDNCTKQPSWRKDIPQDTTDVMLTVLYNVPDYIPKRNEVLNAIINS